MSKLLRVVTFFVLTLSAPAIVQGSPDAVFEAQVTGTLRALPELGILERAPVIGLIASSYFKTTSLNREFRRGYMEFQVPAFGSSVQSATLILTESRATSSFPVPPDVHELSFYPADMALTLEDYDRPTTLLGTLETDFNEVTRVFSFDVTTLVRQFQGASLGFRLKLAVDPVYEQFGSLGSGFGEYPCCRPPRIEVTFGPAEITVPFDIRPESCPNVLNVASRGMLPAAILGTAGFNVLDVDPDSIRLLGVAPLRTELADVSAPSADCTLTSPDGLLDLVMQFDTQQIVQAIVTLLGRAPVDGEVVVLSLEARRLDSTPLTGADSVRIISRKTARSGVLRLERSRPLPVTRW